MVNVFLESYRVLKPYDLTYGEAMFVIHLMQFKWTEKPPFPKYKTISVKTAGRWAQSLEVKKYLVREKRVGTTNLFHLDNLLKPWRSTNENTPNLKAQVVHELF